MRETLSRRTAGLICLGFVIVGGIFAIAAHSVTEEPYHSIFDELGSVALAAGVIGFGYDFFLRKTFMDEVVEKLELQREIEASGFQMLGKPESLRWDNLLRGAKRVTVVAPDPVLWSAHIWPRVAQLVRERRVVLALYLVEPGSPAAAALASRRGIQPATMDASVSEVRNTVPVNWRERASWHQVRKSKLTIYYVREVPRYGFVDTDTTTVVILPGAFGESNPGSEVAVVFAHEGQSGLWKAWLGNQFPESLDAAIAWSSPDPDDDAAELPLGNGAQTHPPGEDTRYEQREIPVERRSDTDG